MVGGERNEGSAWNWPLRRLTLGHFLAASAEWAVYIGAFVYAFQQGGAAATGLASIWLLSITVVASAFAGIAISRLQPNTARLISLTAQAIGCLVAGAVVIAGGPLVFVLAGSALTLSIFTLIRPSQAILVPLLSEQPRQLTTTTLWIGHCDSGAALAGPLASTALLLVGGPGAVLIGFGFALMVAAALQLVDHSRGRSARQAVAESVSFREIVVEPVRQLRDRGGLLAPIGLVAFQYALVGALDILFVVITLDTLELDESASGLLTSSFGAGALGAVALSSVAHRSGRLALSLSAGLAVCGLVTGVLGVVLAATSGSLIPLLIGMPFLGAARFLVLVVSRALLQRSADDDTVGSVFALLEFGSGVGILAGSIVAQVTLSISGPVLTLGVFSAAYLLMLLGTWQSVRQAESSATVPLVEMGLLRKVPAFTPLPPLTLEAVARHGEVVEVESGATVIEQGQPGDRFFAVMTGAFDVVMDDEFVRTAQRGDSFGEVALLADIARTATVTATEGGTLLAIDREPFMRALASHDPARQAMWHTVSEMDFGDQVVTIPDVHEASPEADRAGG